MIGLELNGISRGAPAWWPPAAAYVADFAEKRYMREGSHIGAAQAFSFTRAGDKRAPDGAGIWRHFAADAPAQTDLGLSIEGARTNLVLNAADFSVWTLSNASLTDRGDSVWRINNDNGNSNARVQLIEIAPVDALATRSVFVKGDGIERLSFSTFDSNPGGEPWQRVEFSFATLQVFAQGGVGAPALYGAEPYAEGWYRLWFASTATSSAFTRRFVVRLISADTDPIGSGVLVRWPQLELGDGPTSPILTTGAPAARAPDLATLHLPPGTHDLEIVFEDRSTQTIFGASGDFTLPTTLDRPVIRRVIATET